MVLQCETMASRADPLSWSTTLRCLVLQHARPRDVASFFRSRDPNYCCLTAQESLLNAVTIHPVHGRFLPPRWYLRQVLKAVLQALEEDKDEEVLDQLYETYTQLLSPPLNHPPPGPPPLDCSLHPLPCTSSLLERGAEVASHHTLHNCAPAHAETRDTGDGELQFLCLQCAGLFKGSSEPTETGTGTGSEQFCYKTLMVSVPEPAAAVGRPHKAGTVCMGADPPTPSLEDSAGREEGAREQEGAEPGLRPVVLRVAPNILEGGTGCHLWPASLVLAGTLLAHPSIVTGRRVLELGSGCGLLGIFLSLLPKELQPSEVCLSDGNKEALSNLLINLGINGIPAIHPLKEQGASASEGTFSKLQLHCLHFDWDCVESLCGSGLMPHVVVGADIIYDVAVVPSLVNVLATLLGSSAKSSGSSASFPSSQEQDFAEATLKLEPAFALLACAVRNQETQEAFLASVRRQGLSVLQFEPDLRLLYGIIHVELIKEQMVLYLVYRET